MEKGTLNITYKNKVAYITFGHPASNSLPTPLLKNFTKTLNHLSHNPDIAIIVIKSKGDKVFCAGASFDELLTIKTPKKAYNFFLNFAHLILAFRKNKKIILGRIQEKSVGGGVGIIAACDYCLATEQASIKLSEIAIGIGPFVIEPAITKKIGTANFTELSLEAKQWKNAKWAYEKGLFTKIYPNSKELDNAIVKRAEELADYPLKSLQNLKKIYWKNTKHWKVLLKKRAQISGKLLLNEKTKQRIQKAKNK